jgi:3-phosphoshikimate 1-carboxyvinyltransferase
MAHRALIAAALAEGESRLTGIGFSQDILATMDCLSALGAEFERKGDVLLVRGRRFSCGEAVLFCGESGSTLRFLLPLCLTTGKKMTLHGAGRLMARPLEVYEDLCRERGFFYEKNQDSITLQGRLLSGEYTVPGNVSSQFITGLLFALSLLEGESTLQVTGKWESASYVDMTLFAMKEFGVSVKREGDTFRIPGGQKYAPRDFTVEGDWSNGAFLSAFSLLGGDVFVEGLWEKSLQGDRVYRDIFPRLQAGSPVVDLTDCPDLGPILIALAAYFNGARFTGSARLRIKESDRGAAMAEELKKCGVKIVVEENQIIVPPSKITPPVEPIVSHNDHRIVRAMSVILSRLGGEIEGCEAVNKSYPDFFEVIKKLGIEVILSHVE